LSSALLFALAFEAEDAGGSGSAGGVLEAEVVFDDVEFVVLDVVEVEVVATLAVGVYELVCFGCDDVCSWYFAVLSDSVAAAAFVPHLIFARYKPAPITTTAAMARGTASPEPLFFLPPFI